MEILNNNEVDRVFGGFGGYEQHTIRQRVAEALAEANQPAENGHEWHCERSGDGENEPKYDCVQRPKQQNFIG